MSVLQEQVKLLSDRLAAAEARAATASPMPTSGAFQPHGSPGGGASADEAELRKAITAETRQRLEAHFARQLQALEGMFEQELGAAQAEVRCPPPRDASCVHATSR